MIRHPPRAKRMSTLLPDTKLFRANPPRLPHIRRLRGGARLSFRLAVAASLRMDLLKTPMTRVSGKQLANLSECADFARFPAPPVRPATITASQIGRAHV